MVDSNVLDIQKNFKSAVNEITIRRPDDWHIHLRDGNMLGLTVSHAARQFGRVIVMPNLKPPVDSVKAALEYRSQILEALDQTSNGKSSKQHGFTPLMTLYLTDQVDESVIDEAVATDCIKAVKLYPAGATTNSEKGITDLMLFYKVFERMQKHGMPLLIHGEVTDRSVDIFDREAVFVDRHLSKLRQEFQQLRIVLEHVSSKQGVDFVTGHASNTAATITPHHLMLCRNHIFDGGLHPHHFCLPVVKTEDDRAAIVRAATSGQSCFFAGTDSAPHLRQNKESASGAAGIYSAHAAVELYAQVFDKAAALDERFEAFMSKNGAQFYGLEPSEETMTLVRKSWKVIDFYDTEAGELVPLCAGDQIEFQIVDDEA